MKDIIWSTYVLITFAIVACGIAMAFGVKACVVTKSNKEEIEHLREKFDLMEKILKEKRNEE